MEELIVVKQLPIIDERLQTLKSEWEQLAADAKEMVCTEDTIQAVKAFRSNMRKQFEEVEALRKQVKNAVLEPYQRFEVVYHDCVTNAFREADKECAIKISFVEADMKKRCEDGLKDYFLELCAVHHLDWLTYDRAGIKVDMASAKAKTPSKLRKQLMEFVVGVAESVKRINSLDDAAEIMVEFRRTLNATESICTVQERHRRIEEQRIAHEAHKAALEKEAEVVRRVEALSPPIAVKPEEKDPNEVIPRCTFTAIGATRAQLRKLKEFLNMEGIQYE